MAVGVKFVTLLGRAAMVGSTRGAMVGLIVGVRGAMFTVGARTIIDCADACGMSSQVKGVQTAISAIAAQPAFNRPLIPLAIMKPRTLRRGLGEADDLLAAQLAHQAGDLVPAHRLAAELQAEQAVGAA